MWCDDDDFAARSKRRTIIFSASRLRWGVTDIGLKSEKPVGLLTLGTGVTKAFNQQVGTSPVEKEMFKMYVTTSASS